MGRAALLGDEASGVSDFVHLQVRSCYSLQDGASGLDALCRAARARGQRAWALTDTNGLYGLPGYLLACAHYELEPVVGVELDGRAAGGAASALLLPRRRRGWGALCRAITARHREGPGLDLTAQLDQDGEDLVVLSADAALLQALCRARGPEGLHLALARRSPRLEALAERLGLTPVAVGGVRFAEPEDHARHRVLRAIAARSTLGRLPASALADPGAWLVDEAALRERLWDDEPGRAALRRTRELAEACRFGGADWGYGVLTFPRWEGQDAARVLREEALRGARRRYGVVAGGRLPARVVTRLERELDLVVRKGFADYFLIVRDIVVACPRTCGRGSAAASLIAYALGITHVDPVRHDLFFERFLNEGRVQPPDVDVDFPWDERDEVLAGVFARFGARAAMVANHVCFRPRAALREVARCFGLPEAEVGPVTARLPWFGEGPLAETLAEHPLARGLELPPPWDRILPLAQGLVGLPRHLSVHPGGVVITPGPLTDLVPVETAPKGVPVIQWEKDGAEDAGLVKIDLLGNRSLAVIRDALAAARAHGASPPDYAALAVEDDPRCQEMLARGESMGCFYVESPAMRLLQRRSRRGDFEHLVIHSSIIRPAANEFIREYLRRLHGAPWEPLHPELERLLEGTLGLMAYQEDVARVAIALGGFSPAEADLLRKVLAKKERDYRLADLAGRFESGAAARGVEPALVARTWAMMESFAGYSFCKAHSASYAMVSFQCCWLRDRFPAEFLAAVLSNGGGYYSALGYLGEARRLGLEVRPACVNRSGWAWEGRPGELRVGLMQLRGLRRAAGEALVAARAAGAFQSFADLVARVPELERDELELLVRAGALDALEPAAPGRRARLHWRVALLAPRQAAGGLFPAAALPPQPEPPPVAELSPARLLEEELSAYGMPVSCHPLDLWSPGLEALEVVPAAEVPARVGRRVRVCGWLVTSKLVSTRQREPMEFVTLEDRTGLIEAVVFPDLFARRAQALHAGRPLVLEGRVEQEHGVATLLADGLEAWSGPCRVEGPVWREAADLLDEDLLAEGGAA